MPKQNLNKTVEVNIRPLAGYILVEPSEAEEKSAAGLILPTSSQEKPAQGKVLAVGEAILEGREISSPVKVGDKVIYKKWGGDEIKISGKEMKLVKFDDLMAVIE